MALFGEGSACSVMQVKSQVAKRIVEEVVYMELKSNRAPDR